MKVTKDYLRKIIKESINEASDMYGLHGFAVFVVDSRGADTSLKFVKFVDQEEGTETAKQIADSVAKKTGEYAYVFTIDRENQIHKAGEDF